MKHKQFLDLDKPTAKQSISKGILSPGLHHVLVQWYPVNVSLLRRCKGESRIIFQPEIWGEGTSTKSFPQPIATQDLISLSVGCNKIRTDFCI